MAVKIIIIMVLVLYLGFNIITAKLCSAKEMRTSYVDGQCAVGMVFANIFYAPAWILKFLKYIVVALIK